MELPQHRTDSMRRARRWGIPAHILVALCLTFPAQAQTPEQLLRGLLDAAKQSRNRPGSDVAPTQPGGTEAALFGSQSNAFAVPGPVRWSTRQEFVAATRRGDLIEIKPGGADNDAVLASVFKVMQNDFGVPPISRDCYEHGGFKSDVVGLLADIAEGHAMTLSMQPPDFTNRQANRAPLIDQISRQIKRLESPPNQTHCDAAGRGGVIPHPYKAALIQLAGDYSRATQALIEEDRAKRVAAYQRNVARDQAEQQQRQSETRAAEQQRIDAEAMRIRADEQRRAVKEKSRVGG